MKKVFWIWCMGVCLLFGCAGDEDCVPGDVPFMSLEDLGCTNTNHQMMVNTQQEFVLIRNQEEYDAMITSSCEPDIDWMQWDLIAGMRGLTMGLTSVDKSLVKGCIDKKLKLRITFNLNATLVAPIVSFHALIPKLANDETIFVDLIVQGG